MIKRTKVDLKEERKILTQMIVDSAFLKQMIEIIDVRLFESAFVQRVGGWVTEYYNFTEEAPEKNIQEIYIQKRKEISSEDEIDLIGEFLSALSKDYERGKIQNLDYSVNNAVFYFKKQSIKNLRQRLQDALDAEDMTAAENIIGQYRRVEKITGQGVDLLNDAKAIRDAFNEEFEYLFHMPGDLGKAIGPLNRGDFIAYVGPPKRGKTFWMLETAWRPVFKGLKVFFASLEMQKPQMVRRAWQAFTGQPKHSGEVEIPYFINTDDDNMVEISYKKVKKNGVGNLPVEDLQKKYKRASRGGNLKIVCYPAGCASVNTIEQTLSNFETYENWIPDVIVVDYADLLQPDAKIREYRHQIDGVWKELRAMAQKRNCLVVTGSQAGRQTLDRDAKSSDVSEDIRKVAHVTCLIVLNQTPEEKKQKFMRLGIAAQREGAPEHSEVVVLQNLEIGRPCLDTRYKTKVKFSED
mgnify:CR=1 FL=1